MRRAIVLMVALITPLVLFAQTSAITGTVTDENGNPLANAAIQVANTDTETYYKATSASTGAYTVGALPPGRYFLLVTTESGRYTKTGITVRAGETVRVDARILRGEQPGPTTDITLGTLGEADVRDAKRAIHGAPAGPTPRTAGGKPDLSGMWRPQRVLDAGAPDPLPWAAALIK